MIEEKVENDFPQPSVAWTTLAILFLAYVLVKNLSTATHFTQFS